MLRIVLDTNVFVSGLLSKTGPPARLLDAWRDGQYTLVTAPQIIAEIKRVLSYPKLRRKYPMDPEEMDGLITLLEKDALVVPGLSEVKGSLPDDPNDEIFLSCALDAGADFIVSGDRHLLNLGEYRGIPVLTVRRFLDRIKPSP